MLRDRFPWLNFSVLEVTESLGGSLNPLGLMNIHGSISDIIFPQFTTLTHNPRSHSILLAIYDYFEESGILVKGNGLLVREAENFWGLLQASLAQSNEVEGVVSPLNVEKYNAVLSELDVVDTKKAIDSRYKLDFRLGYGLNAFYVQPSARWGFLNTKTLVLSEAGKTIGRAFNEETGFSKELKEWMNGKSYKLSDFSGLAKDTMIGELGNKEKVAWSKGIQNYVKQSSLSSLQRDLWEGLEIGEDVNLSTLRLLEVYKDNKDIVEVINLQEAYGRLAGICEFFFELFYLYAQRTNFQELTEEGPLSTTSGIEEIFEVLKPEYSKAVEDFFVYSKSFNSVKEGFFSRLKEASSFKGFKEVLISNHTAIQKKKGKSAFFSEDLKVLQFNEINFERVKNLISEYDSSIIIEKICENYIYDWRFSKASNYKWYVSGK